MSVTCHKQLQHADLLRAFGWTLGSTSFRVFLGCLALCLRKVLTSQKVLFMKFFYNDVSLKHSHYSKLYSAHE